MSQLHVLKLDISHGSDRHEISLYSTTPPTVGDCMHELEKKTRVPVRNIKLVFKGQVLLDVSRALSAYGVFSGSKLVMIGDKLNPIQDALFRRVLGINKDVDLIAKSLQETRTEFGIMQNRVVNITLVNDYTPQMHQRACGFKKDLETFLRVVDELEGDEMDPDVRNAQQSVIQKIQGHLESCDGLIQQIADVARASRK